MPLQPCHHSMKVLKSQVEAKVQSGEWCNISALACSTEMLNKNLASSVLDSTLSCSHQNDIAVSTGTLFVWSDGATLQPMLTVGSITGNETHLKQVRTAYSCLSPQVTSAFFEAAATMVAAPDFDLASMQAQRGPQHPPGVALGGASRALQLCQLAATESCCASLPAQLQHHMTQGHWLACSC